MSLLNRLKSWWGASDASVQKIDLDKADLEVPRYPPFMKGLPAVPPQRLIDSQSELLAQLDRVVTVGAGLYGKHYKAVLHRFASYCHLLPASQGHHHRGAGGLLRHSIEVGLWAAQASDKLLLDLGKTPAQRRQIEPRWQATAFIAGLCHDVGKPATDIVVTSADRTLIWKPLKQNLSDWAAESNISSYFLDWKQGRAKQHVALSTLLAERIIGPETLAWIEEGGTELVVWLMEALNANPGARNPLYDLVVKADQASVDRDMKTLGVAMAGYEIGVPIERHLTDIMRRLIKEGTWSVNVPGARIWNIEGAIFLVWPAAGEEIARLVREDGVPGIPRTGDGILDMLVERQLAFVRDSEDGDRLWKVAPEILVTKEGKQLTLACIRLKNDAMIASTPLAAVHGSVLNGVGAPQPEGQQIDREDSPEPEATEPAPDSEGQAAAVADEPQAAKKSPAKSKKAKSQDDEAGQNAISASLPKTEVPRQPTEMVVDQDSGEILSMKVTQADGTQRELKMRKVELAGEGKKGLSSPVALRLKPKSTESGDGTDPATPESDLDQPRPKEGDASPAPADVDSPPRGKGKGKRKGVSLSHAPTMEFDGAVGAMFQAIVDDLKSGAKRWDVDVRLDAEEMVHLKWPMAFAGYGLSPKNILDECSQKKWLWVDDYAPLVRLVDSTFEGQPCKALRLNVEASYTFIYMAGYTGQAAAVTSDQVQKAATKTTPSSREQATDDAPQEVSHDDGPPPHFDDVPPPELSSMVSEPDYQSLPSPEPVVVPVPGVDNVPGPASSPPVAQDTRKEREPAVRGASRAARNESPSPSPPAKPPKGVPAQSGAAQRPQQQPSPQRPKSAGEPLPSTKSFQATKFDKFMVAITAMDGVPFEDGWVSLERRDCLAACKSAGVDISRSELKSFCDYASDYLRVDGTRILHKPKKS